MDTILRNTNHRRALRLKFNTLSWRDGKETASELAARVWSAALAFSGKSSDGDLLDCFVQSLPPNMLNLALSISRPFDEVTAGVTMATLDAN